MKCFEDGILQAYLDGELEIDTKKQLENHLLVCSKCKDCLNQLKANDDFAFEKINSYKRFTFDNMHSIREPVVSKFKNKLGYTNSKGEQSFMSKYKKLLATACSAAIVVSCISIQPVRAAISNVLSVFRVESIQSVNITLKDLDQIRDKLNNLNSDVSMDKFGRISRHGGELKEISFEEALKLSGNSSKLLPAELSAYTPKITTVEPANIEFNLKVKNINSVLKSIGTQKLLPENIEDKTFYIRFPQQLSFNYKINNKFVDIIQMKSPEIEVPEGVSEDEIYECLINLPILPDNIKNQLKSINDWKSTLYIPVLKEKSEEVDINGCKGYLSSDINNHTEKSTSYLIWYNNGIIYGMVGDMDKAELLKIANSIK
ncbi:MAG: DUF4367 domain-containing protein [Deltaproteobacteria bacterium]